MKHGKKYVDGAKLIERSRLYDTQEALDLCVKTGTAKFDETVEVHVKLGVDGRHADQQVRGAIVLPHGTGKTVRVLVFAKGPRLRKPRPLALISLAIWTWCRRSSRKTGLASTSALPRLT